MSLTGVEKSKLCEAVSHLEFSAASGATGIRTAGTGPRTTWFFWSYPYRAVLTSQNLLWIWHFFKEKLNFLTLDFTSFLGYSIYVSHLSHFIGKAILRKVVRLETIETSWTDSLVLDKVRVIKQKTH